MGRASGAAGPGLHADPGRPLVFWELRPSPPSPFTVSALQEQHREGHFSETAAQEPQPQAQREAVAQEPGGLRVAGVWTPPPVPPGRGVGGTAGITRATPPHSPPPSVPGNCL